MEHPRGYSWATTGGGGVGGSGSGVGGGEGGHTDWQVTTSHERPIPGEGGGMSKPYSPDGQEFVKVVLLGAPGVGKTAIVQQFVWGTFEASYYPTSKKETYYPSVILHDRNYSLKIVDIPDLPFFPVNSCYNISDLQAYGLRDANAYVLVYDLLAPDSFDYINNLFNQINESRDLSNVPVVVVGNKTDKVNFTGRSSAASASRKYDTSSSKYRSSSGSGGHHSKYDKHDAFSSHHDHGGGHDSFRSGYHHDAFHQHHGSHGGGSGGSRHRSSHFDDHKHQGGRHMGGFRSSSSHGGFHSSSSSHFGGSSSSSRSRHSQQHQPKKHFFYEEDNFLERETAEKVQGEWKAIYKECSAQDPESVTRIFKSLMEVVEERGLDDGLDDGVPKRCTIL